MSDDTTTARAIELYIDGPTNGCLHLEQIRVHTKTECEPSKHQRKLVFWQSRDGRDWAGPYDFLTADLANSRTIQSATATWTNFGLKLRFALVVG